MSAPKAGGYGAVAGRVGNSDLPPAESIVGRLIANRYLIRGACEQTPTSARYHALHVGSSRPALLRVLPARSAVSREACRRALERADRVSALPCAHVERTFDVGLIAGRWPFVVSEHSQGKSLEQVLAESGPLPPERLLPITCQAASALEAAHAMGLTHGTFDLDNLWLEPPHGRADWLRVTGFGLSELPPCEFEGASSGVFQTARDGVRSAAPRDPNIQGDIYAFGSAMYELASGSRPFWSGSELFSGSATTTAGALWPAGSAVTRAFSSILHRCLQTHPLGGYTAMALLRVDLERVRTAVQVMAAQPNAVSAPVTAIHAPAPRLRGMLVKGPKVIVRGG